jgi:hypothetical protein
MAFDRVTVEEFLKAREEFPGVVVTECWYRPGLNLTGGKSRPCSACALTVVGLARGYVTLDQLDRAYRVYESVYKVVDDAWSEKTSKPYVNNFVEAFDGWDSEEADLEYITDDPDRDFRDEDFGYYDGAACRVALDTALQSPGGDS